jgi:hypothetical protein
VVACTQTGAIPTSRRTFIAGLGAVSASSLAPAAIQGGTPTASGGEATARGTEPDLAYLNTTLMTGL